MQLPPALRQAIDRELEGVALADLARAAETLSRRYRAEIRDGRLHVDDALAARAYLTTRLPATFAAIAAAGQAVIEARPDFAPAALLDIGAGPGTAAWAAAALWPSLTAAELVEASGAMREIGGRLGSALALDRVAWHAGSATDGLARVEPADLVLLAYVLDELAPAARPPLIERLWALTGDVLLLVEPGTTEGWKRILAARDQLIGLGAHILAPCPHRAACPLAPPDWCHFSARVARSRLHREAKGGSVPWEDEKFIYLAASRVAGAGPAARILAQPQQSKAEIRLKLCLPDGSQADRRVAKRDAAAFKAARKRGWGESYPM